MRRILLCFFMLMASTSILKADAVTFEATVNSPQVSLDEIMQLTLTVTGVNNDLDPVSLPVIDGFSAKYLGPSTSTSFVFVNGKSESHSERSFVYNLFPNRVGKFQIPAISATIAGQTYTTKPIDVEVLAGSVQAQAASGGAPVQNQAPSEESLKDKILVKVLVDKNDVYLNERIPVTIKLLVNDVPIRDIQYPQFEKEGVVVDDFEKPLQSSEVDGGIRYDTVEFKTNIYPDRLGDLTFGPAQIQGNVLYKTGQENPFDQANSVFGADVFNNFFDSYAARPVTVASQPVKFHVSSLPEDGRPDDFSGAIGQFDFQAGVSPLQVKAGDPLTLKMDIKGSGNFKDLKMPEFQAPGFKSYTPQIKSVGDDKTVEQVIIPISTGTKEVPALRFSYFDTSSGSYKTITRGPFSVQVMAPSPDQEFKAIGFSDVSKQASTLPADQSYFVKIFKKIRQFLTKLFGSIWFWFAFGAILAAGVSFLLWRRFQDRLLNDPAFARRFKAVKEARQGLVQAEECISTGKTKEFYGLLSKALRDYLANKLDRSSAALSVNDILSLLKAAKLDEAHIAQLKSILEQSDLVCFAGADRDVAQMHADLSQAQGLVAHLERSLK